MNIINEVKINNYKGFEEIKFPCDSINIIVGPNNTGKSSILESIWMAISSLNNFEDELETNINHFIVDDDNKNIEYLIHQGNKRAKIELCTSMNKNITLELLYSEVEYYEEISELFLNYLNELSMNDIFKMPFEHYSYSNELKELLISGHDINKLKHKGLQPKDYSEELEIYHKKRDSATDAIRKYLIKSKKLFITSKINNELNVVSALISNFGYVDLFKSETFSDYKIPLIFSSPEINEDISDLIKKSVETKSIADVLDGLKNRIQYFEDIRETGGELFVLLDNLNEPLPLAFMGDGFESLLKLSFMAPLIKNGVILFEEPEVSMHPGYLDILAKEIILNSGNSQFFITTHSLELLKRILIKSEKYDKLESIRILRLRRYSEGYIDRETLTGKEAMKEMEIIETDLRGF